MFDTVYVPSAVVTEILRGKELTYGFASAIEVEDAIENGWIKIIELESDDDDLAEKYSHDPGIHLGESEVLSIGGEGRLLVTYLFGAR
jgi:hypothetical protein